MNRQYEEEMHAQAKLLDTYDFIPYLHKYNSLRKLMEDFEVEHKFDSLPEIFEGNIFNFFTFEDFKDYLNNRYTNCLFLEHVDYNWYFIGV